MDRARLDTWLEKGILGLVTLILVLGPLLYGSTPTYAMLTHEWLIVVALGLWVVRIWIRPEYRILWPPFAWTVIAFVAYAVWQLNNAQVIYAARVDVNRIILYAALFFLILDNLNRQEWTQYLACLIVFVGMSIAMYAIYQYVARSKYVLFAPQYPEYLGRASGTFICPNHLAGYLAMSFPLAFGLTIMARLKPVMKVFLGYAGVVMLAGLFVTSSRGGAASAIVGLIVLFSVLVFNRDFRLPAAVALFLLIAPAVYLGVKSSRLQTRIQTGVAGGEVAGDRAALWRAARTMWHEKFWTGVGPNHFDLRFREFRPFGGQFQSSPNRAHNDYLNTLADWGMIGFGLIAIAWGVFWLGVARIWRFVRRANDFGSKQSTRAGIVLGCCAGLVALLAHSFVDFDMHIPALAMLSVTLLAIVTGHWRFATERFWVNPGIVGRIAASAVCLAAIGWIGFQAVRSGREYSYLKMANRRGISAEERLGALKQAFAVEPQNATTAYRIGELLRVKSWTMGPDYRERAEEAMKWFDVAMQLDPYEPDAVFGKGMCLHWLERPNEAWPYFRKGIVMDRNSYFACAMYGWHFVQLQAWLRAAKWFELSLALMPQKNTLARTYWGIIERKLQEQGQPLKLSTPLPPEEATEPANEAPQ